MEQERNTVQNDMSSTINMMHNEKYPQFSIKQSNGIVEALDIDKIQKTIAWASRNHKATINAKLIIEEMFRNIFDGVTHHEVAEALVLATIAFIERDPAYGYAGAQLVLKKLFKEVTNTSVFSDQYELTYKQSLIETINLGVQNELYDKRLLDFDLAFLAEHMQPQRDQLFDYMGLRTLYERYFIQLDDKRIELPQVFWMRVAMGLCYNEQNKNERALEFYNTMSLMHYVPSTPTLLHSSLKRPQLSSCFLTTVYDDLHHIFKCLGDNAQLSKWSGGVANDWTNIRAVGSMIKSIKTESQGVVPFLKINNAVTAAINRSGKRRAATVVYLETWHYEIEDFLDLRRNTGDERRRTHDINTANWVPDLFMKRVISDGKWTLFSPEEVPELHHIYGKEFEEKYIQYEQKAQNGEIELFKVIEAKQLWRKMLSRLFETGHPWLTFKDPCNVRSPQDHVGVVHSSNLCTEITLNTNEDEVAVCNLGSVNLSRHINDGIFDNELLAKTVETAIRMLDNVVDINFYPIKEAENANLRHRPIGLGVMGLQDALYKLNISFDSPDALEFADQLMERVSYSAILSSSKLAKERGAYESFKGSKWDRNLFPIDTIDMLEKERGKKIEVNRKSRLDWAPVRKHVQEHGMRNSNTMAIAPTATISTIAGSFPSIEPIYKNIYVKANMSGEFTVVNKYLIQDLKDLGLWNNEMLEKLKYFDGQVNLIEEVPQWVKDKYKEAFDIDPSWLVQITAVRTKWIDQSQSHNVFLKGVSGKKLSDIYIQGWKAGLKTFYYLRTLGASQIEKSTLDAKKFGYTQKREYENGNGNGNEQAPLPATDVSCSLSNDPECEVCQ